MATWSVGFGDESRLMTGIMRLWSMAGIWLQRTLQISRNRSLISGGSGVPGVEGRRSNLVTATTVRSASAAHSRSAAEVLTAESLEPSMTHTTRVCGWRR